MNRQLAMHHVNSLEKSTAPRLLDREFYQGDTLEVARSLLGCTLCRMLPDGRVLRGRLVEVEAYDGPQDRASHAHRGLTQRNSVMFGPPGYAYVYLVYGLHHCLNIVTGPEGYPAAVLLRAAEMEDGTVSASGPGRLTRAFNISRDQNGASFQGPELWVEAAPPLPKNRVMTTCRIGVQYAGSCAARPYRFAIDGDPAVSGPKRLARR